MGQVILDFIFGDFMLLVYIVTIFILSTRILGKWLEKFFIIELPIDEEDK